MYKVLVATDKPFAAEAVTKIRNVVGKAGYELHLLEKYTDKSQLLEAVVDKHALIIRSDIVDARVLDAAGQLKIIVRAGAGYDNVDLNAATSKNVVVMNTPGQNSNAVAELAFGLMVYQARKMFSGKSGTELRGKRLGIMAYGNVGRYIAQIARGFAMQVSAFDPFLPEDVFAGEGLIQHKTEAGLFAENDYVSLNVPLTEKTRASVNYDLLSKLPKNGVVVNTARKEIIDEAGLLKAFAGRPDIAYLSDIAPDCAVEFESKYAGRFFFTPKKMGAQTEEANINAGVAAAEQIVRFLQTGDRTFQVNK